MPNVNFINKGKLNAGDINTITQAFYATTPTSADKIHLYMDGSRSRMDDRELLYLNKSLIKNFTPIAGSSGSPYAFFEPTDYDPAGSNAASLDIDPATGTLWVLDSITKKIYNVERDGTQISNFAITTIDGTITAGLGLAYDPSDGTLWVTETTQDKVFHATTEGVFISSFLTSAYDAAATLPFDLTVDGDGTLWITDGITDKIYNITKTGTLITSFASPGPNPSGVTIDPDGTLWISDSSTDLIYNVTKAGAAISNFPVTNIDPLATNPFDCIADPDGTFWVSDIGIDKIYNTAGKLGIQMEDLLANGLIIEHLDQDNIYVKD